MKTCATCQFYIPEQPVDPDNLDLGSEGYCQRFPPQVVRGEGINFRVWPPVKGRNDTCGEHTSRLHEEPPKAPVPAKQHTGPKVELQKQFNTIGAYLMQSLRQDRQPIGTDLEARCQIEESIDIITDEITALSIRVRELEANQK